MGVLGCVLAFSLVIFLNYIDVPMFISAVVASMVAILFNGMPLVGTMVETFFPKCGYYFGFFMGLYIFGAILGQLYSISGAGSTVALTIMNWLSNDKTSAKKKDLLALIITIVAGFILSYGGVQCVVLVFTLYPIGLVLFEKCDIPRKYLVGTIIGGTTAFAMTAPGSPQPPNVAAMALFNTSSFQGWIPGIIGCVVEFVVMLMILYHMIEKAKKRGEHFTYGEKDVPYQDDRPRPSFLVSILPLIVTYALFNIVKLNVIFAVAVGVVLAVLLFRPYFEDKSVTGIFKQVGVGANAGTQSMGLVAFAYGFGATMQFTPGFQSIVNFFCGLDISPVILLVVAVAILAAMTGGSGSSQQLAVPMILPTLEAKGLTGAFIHRISCFAGSTLDTLPSSGAVLTGVRLSGIPMKEAYPACFVCCVMATTIGTIVVAAVSSLFPILTVI